jgi:hypothetical protein
MKKQNGGRINRLTNRASKISDRMADIKSNMPDEGVLPPFAQRYGDKLNKKYTRNENRLNRVTSKIDKLSQNKKGGPITALDQVDKMEKAKLLKGKK